MILAEMVSAALAWERAYGVLQHNNHKTEPQKPLTIIGVTDTLNASENTVKGENYDRKNNIKKYTS
jgi:hypothetical protein